MGDPAGIGPEICIGTILERETYDVCRPFIIGSIAILEKAAKVLGKDLERTYSIIKSMIHQKQAMNME